MEWSGQEWEEYVCGDDGHVICEEGEVRKRWRDYFAMLVQSDDQPLQQEVPQGDADM